MAGKRRYARRMETDAPHHGERMNKLVSAMNKATEKVLSNCTRQAFLECYPTELTSKHREVFTAAHEQFLANLGKNIKDELSIVSDRYEIVAKLQLIDQWKEDQLLCEIRSASLEPLQAPPNDLVKALEIGNKRQEQQRLLDVLQELEHQRERLLQEHQENSKRHQRLVNQLEENTQHIERAVAVGRQWAQSDTRDWQSKH